MKKISFLFLAICYSITSLGQSDDLPANRQHEFRFDAIEAIASANLEISYEYIVNKYSGFGGSITVGLDNDDISNLRFAITPYYRQYFFNKKDYGARGLFVEGFGQFSVFETLESTFNNIVGDSFDVEETTESAFGLGLAVGQKWVSKNGFVFEISTGLGRRFGSDIQDVDEFFFRGGILIGYRIF